MLDAADELLARAAAFRWLDQRLAGGQSELSREELESFRFGDLPLKLIDPGGRGIRNPAEFTATLSVLTTPNGPYKDEPVANGLFRYAYRSNDSADNKKLRRAALMGVPLIYFRGVRPKAFVAHYPVYAYDLPSEQAVLLAIGDDLRAFGEPSRFDEAQRSYVERITRQRLHQPVFRAKVMHAYKNQCAVCNLKHSELLDAAHIIADALEAGQPTTSNGIALCKIHHAAYDKNFLGISPDYVVHINESLMVEVDGPMLKYGLQAMNKRALSLPPLHRDRPRKDNLDIRFQQFQAKAL